MGAAQKLWIVETTFIINLVSWFTACIVAIIAGEALITTLVIIYTIISAVQFLINYAGCVLLGMDLKICHPVSLVALMIMAAAYTIGAESTIGESLGNLRITGIIMIPYILGNIIAYGLFLKGKSFFKEKSLLSVERDINRPSKYMRHAKTKRSREEEA